MVVEPPPARATAAAADGPLAPAGAAPEAAPEAAPGAGTAAVVEVPGVALLGKGMSDVAMRFLRIGGARYGAQKWFLLLI